MIIGYIRVSTLAQDLNNQKNIILTYCNNRKMLVDEFVEVQISSRKSQKDRKIVSFFKDEFSRLSKWSSAKEKS